MHQHLPLDSIAFANRWSRRHPAEKSLLAGGLLLAALVSPKIPVALTVAAAVTILAIGLAGVPAAHWFRFLAMQSAFLVPAMLVLGWQTGWGRAMVVSARSLAATSCLMLLAFTTPIPTVLGYAGRSGRLASLVELAALVYRLIAVSVGAIRVTRAAVDQRLTLDTRWREWKAVRYVPGRVLTRTMDRAVRLDRGFRCRGIEGVLPVYDLGISCSWRFVTGTLVLLALIFLIGRFA